MNTRLLITLAFAAVALLPAEAVACKELSVFPQHLDLSQPPARSQYHVALIKAVKPDGASVLITQSFGSKLKSGSYVTVRFKQREEAHAVCPIQLMEGRTYLLAGIVANGSIEISRFDGMNIPETHPRFSTYVNDLASNNSTPSSAGK